MTTQFRVKDTQLLIQADDAETNSLLITRAADAGMYSVISIRMHEIRALSLALTGLLLKYEETFPTSRTVH